MLFHNFLSKGKKEAEEARKQEVRAEIKELFSDFLKGDGSLPKGFSEPYNKIVSSDYILRGTPFEEYLKEIRKHADMLRNQSGISEWLMLDETVDPDNAASAIAVWAKRHREMNGILQEKCSIANTTIMLPVFPYCTEKIMVVLKDGKSFQNISPQSREACLTERISFCTVLSDHRLYDLMEQKEKEIQYITYPNYHDETYAEWYFCEATQA